MQSAGQVVLPNVIGGVADILYTVVKGSRSTLRMHTILNNIFF